MNPFQDGRNMKVAVASVLRMAEYYSSRWHA